MTVGSNYDLEEHLMAMLYRHHAEFAVGHGISVHTEVSEESSDRAVLIQTKLIPTSEVPRTAPPTAEDAEENSAFAKLDGLVLDMKELANANATKMKKMLGPLVTAYGEWIDGEEAKLGDPKEGLSQFGDAPRVAIANCCTTLERIEAGFQILDQDSQAVEAFQFMNQAMWHQRTHSIYAEDVRRGAQPDFVNVGEEVRRVAVTPFSPGALQRGLAGLLVSLVRLRGTEFNPNDTASRITTGDPYVQESIETIAKRAELIGDGPKTGDYCRAEFLSKADIWQAEAQNTAGGRTLTYKQVFGEGAKKGTTVSLLSSPGLERWEEFTCLNSLREVEPSVKFIISDGGLDGAVGDDDDEAPKQEEEQA